MNEHTTIRIANKDDEIEGCFAVMAELRPHLARDQFVERVRRQGEDNYRLAYLDSAGNVTAVAGFRISECLAWGKFLYVDDLVTASSARSRGRGQALLTWLVEHARANDCDELHLDSGVQRFGAHRFYLREGMDITSHHFVRKLKTDDS